MDIKEYMLTRKSDIENLEVLPRESSVFLSKNFIASVVGPRRAGKTYFLYHLILNELNLDDSRYIFINFEDESIKISKREDIIKCIEYHNEIYGKLPEYLFFDEIQSFDRWENWIYELYEKKRFYIFLTGSSSKLLSKEIATQLRGRATNIPIFPFSFREFLQIRKFETKNYYSSYEKAKLLNLLRNYLQYGGFPALHIDKVNPAVFFRDYIDTVVYRDVVERYKIKEPELISMLMKFAASSFSSQFSINKVFKLLKSRHIGVSRKTLYSYFGFILNAFFAFTLKKFSYSERESELSKPKVYLVDSGIINYLLETKISENIGRLMENLVFLEIKKQVVYGKLGQIFYFKDAQQHEVDFVIKEGLQIKELIQVTYANSFDEVERREIRALLKAGDLLRCNNLTVITWDYEDEREVKWFNRKGIIKFVPLWKWLLTIG